MATMAVATPCAAQAFNAQGAVAVSDTPRVRPHAIEYSDAYNTRLTIHRWGSCTMLPLFASEYYLGNRLLNGHQRARLVQDRACRCRDRTRRFVHGEYGDRSVESVGFATGSGGSNASLCTHRTHARI